MVITTCRSCHRPVRWVFTTKGRRMPLEVEPDPDGNIVEVVNLNGAATTVRVLRVGEDASDQVRYASHWQHCPQADQWRTKRAPVREA